ncbi:MULTISPECIES: hypothetical protein [Bacillus cereus group]|uniref:hypothetical protein n=1 Tax=Bacillus cereus group TaxID=86661 RepID=UPI001419EF91|nr:MULTISPECIES: hypothetical protein [Bacillus cereus group]MDC7732016.1 hypothetical protein [Bacillus thuringiensis]
MTKTNTTTIQISVYDWSIMEEIIYEARIGSIIDFLSLTYRFDKKVKYKKTTDKNWYYGKTMIKRLFKKEIAIKPTLKFVTTNDLNKIEEEKRKAAEEIRLKEEEKEREEMGWGKRNANPKLGIEEIQSMSEDELVNRLIELYVDDYYIGKTGFNSYDGHFGCNLTETTYIELQVSSELADRAYHTALEFLCKKTLPFKSGDRLPMSKIFRLTDDYKLVSIKKDKDEDLLPSF